MNQLKSISLSWMPNQLFNGKVKSAECTFLSLSNWSIWTLFCSMLSSTHSSESCIQIGFCDSDNVLAFHCEWPFNIRICQWQSIGNSYYLSWLDLQPHLMDHDSRGLATIYCPAKTNGPENLIDKKEFCKCNKHLNNLNFCRRWGAVLCILYSAL